MSRSRLTRNIDQTIADWQMAQWQTWQAG
jgi:hypothetical protein